MICGVVLFGSESASAATTKVPNLSAFCTAANLQAAATSITPTVTIGPVSDGPPLAAGIAARIVDVFWKDAASSTGVAYVPASGNVPDYCEVTGTVVTNPATGKTANFLEEFPSSWNGKLLFSGCAANCGGIIPPESDVLEHGYAAVATDDGHTALDQSAGFFDGSWAVTTPGTIDADAVTDFYYRAVHFAAAAGKQLAVRFYAAALHSAQSLSHSYFRGCSDGGREAMVEATKYPQDFDGIIAGDPFFDVRGQNLAGLQVSKVQLLAQDAAITPGQFSYIDTVVHAQCDAADGVPDGLIQNPALCTFNPQKDLPVCPTQVNGICFTPDQIHSLSAMFSAVTDERGNVIHAGYPVSDLADAKGGDLLSWAEFGAPPSNLTGPEPWNGYTDAPGSWKAADNIFKYLVYADAPGYNSLTSLGMTFKASPIGGVTVFHAVVPSATVVDIDRQTEAGDADIPETLSPFITQGRHILLYHGFSDGLITPFRTVQYYEALANLNGGYSKLQNNARLFMVPGQFHCASGGPGPTKADYLTALENWVENGIAPDGIPATSTDGSRTMPLCKFPEQATYIGTGTDQASYNLASNWTCQPSDTRLLQIGQDGFAAGLGAPLQ